MTSPASDTTAETVLLSAAPLHFWSCLYPGERDGNACFRDRVVNRLRPFAASDTQSFADVFGVSIEKRQVHLILSDRTFRAEMFPGPARSNLGIDWSTDNPLRNAAASAPGYDAERVRSFLEHVVGEVCDEIAGVFRASLIDERLMATGILLTNPSQRMPILPALLEAGGYLEIPRNEIQLRQQVFIDVRIAWNPKYQPSLADFHDLIRAEGERVGRALTQTEAEKIAREWRIPNGRTTARNALVKIQGLAKPGPKGPHGKTRQST